MSTVIISGNKDLAENIILRISSLFSNKPVQKIAPVSLDCENLSVMYSVAVNNPNINWFITDSHLDAFVRNSKQNKNRAQILNLESALNLDKIDSFFLLLLLDLSSKTEETYSYLEFYRKSSMKNKFLINTENKTDKEILDEAFNLIDGTIVTLKSMHANKIRSILSKKTHINSSCI